MATQLTDMQRAFALEYAMNGGNATAAAKSAGYSPKSASEQGRQLLQISHVQEAIQRELMRQRFRAGAIGLDTMIRIAINERISAAARVSAARALMEHAGMLGTAKEIIEARDEADNNDLKQPVNYLEVLSNLGRINGKAECQEKH